MNDKQRKAYNILATKMDNDYAYKLKLKEFFMAHGFIPDASPEFPSIDHHRESFEAFKRDRFRSWREMPKVRRRLIKAAKKAAKAKGLEKLTEEAQA